MLDHDLVVLNSLIATTIDSALGFERAAEDAQAGRFQEMFSDFARERRGVVTALQAAVRELGGVAEDDGSLEADLHRRWVDLRAAITGNGGDKAIIDEVERGEDYIKEKYEAALADPDLAEGTRGIISIAYESVRAGHDTASALKHRMRGAAE
ncbi:MAG: family four-helix-bundle protein [Alphaproteobacteria bacterium]|nr:family four-helix-bundle protein [Alphaproteobacteria bacterium]